MGAEKKVMWRKTSHSVLASLTRELIEYSDNNYCMCYYLDAGSKMFRYVVFGEMWNRAIDIHLESSRRFAS